MEISQKDARVIDFKLFNCIDLFSKPVIDLKTLPKSVVLVSFYKIKKIYHSKILPIVGLKLVKMAVCAWKSGSRIRKCATVILHRIPAIIVTKVCGPLFRKLFCLF